MKKIITLTALFFATNFYVQSQEITPEKKPDKKFHHEIGIDMYPVILSIFKPDNQGWWGGTPPKPLDYNFTYRW